MTAIDAMGWQRFYSGKRTDLNPGDRFYHGTRADLKPGDLVQPGHPPNFGKLDRATTYVYFSATLDAASGERSWPAATAEAESTSWNRPGRLWTIPI